jgi:hypothetical protein
VIVHLIDGTYELFRHFLWSAALQQGKDAPFGAVIGVLNGALQMIEEGATHLGVADRSRDRVLPQPAVAGYKTGDGIEPALFAQFHRSRRAWPPWA